MSSPAGSVTWGHSPAFDYPFYVIFFSSPNPNKCSLFAYFHMPLASDDVHWVHQLLWGLASLVLCTLGCWWWPRSRWPAGRSSKRPLAHFSWWLCLALCVHGWQCFCFARWRSICWNILALEVVDYGGDLTRFTGYYVLHGTCVISSLSWSSGKVTLG